MKTMYDHVFLSLKKIYADKLTGILFTFLFIANISYAQPAPSNEAGTDSLNNIIKSNWPDSNKVHAFYWLARGTTLSNTNQSVEFGNKGVHLARKIKFPMGELECLEALSFSYAITSSTITNIIYQQ